MNRDTKNKAIRLQEDGIALILVLLVVSALSVLILNLNYTTRINLHLAENFRDDIRAYFLIRGAIEAAIYWLEEDMNPIDYDAICDAGDMNCDNEWSLDNEGVEIGGGMVKLKIRDEDGKVWVNDTQNLFNDNPAQNKYMTLLNRLETNLQLEPEVFDSIQDWIDTNPDVHNDGAEEDFYNSLDEPYEIRNGPLLDISELMLIKGIDRTLYETGPTEFTNPVGLKTLFRTVGEKNKHKINVNTAPADVLSALGPSIDGETVAADRIGAPFTNIGDFYSVVGSQSAVDTQLRNLLTVNSSYFSANIDIKVNKVTKRARVVLKRDTNNVTILFWREE